jgi:hypothetical protein
MVLFTITNRRLTDGDRRSFRIGKGQDLSESPDILTFFLSSIAARETHVIYLFARSEHVWSLLGYCDTPICLTQYGGYWKEFLTKFRRFHAILWEYCQALGNITPK